MIIKVLCVAGARPNFPKIAPLMRAFNARPEQFQVKLVNTGQHYDEKLAKVFFEDLAIPRPDMNLEVGSASHAVQTAEIMKRFETVIQAENPHVVIVVGDVNSTAGCALVTAKHFLPEEFRFRGKMRKRPVMVHVEAGLRSFDDDMPEETNRKVTDVLSDVLYVSDPAGMTNLKAEGVADERVEYVGNVMIDTLLYAKEKAMQSDIMQRLDLTERGYGLVTLHRPSNVDEPEQLKHLLGVLDEVSHDQPLVFPVHPRTRARLKDMGFELDAARWRLVEPLGYLDFLRLMASAKVVLSDSGGIQEETTVLGTPCVTLRENTERPCTIEEGTNVLAGSRRETILPAYNEVMSRKLEGRIPKYWDGKTAERIAESLLRAFA